MTRKLKRLGLLLAAALVIGALASATASAETLHFFAESLPATLKGTSAEDVLTTTVGTVKCKEATYSGSQGEQETTTVEVEPVYSGCTAFGFPGEISANGCKYRLKGGEIESGNREGTLDVVCPAGKEITVVAKSGSTTKCTLHLPAQSNLGTVTFTNVHGSSPEISAKLSVGKIKYTHTTGTGLGACAAGSSESGSYAGTMAIKGKTEAEADFGVAVLVPKPLFTVSPNPLDFKGGGKDTKKMATIENQSLTENPKIDFIYSPVSFKPDFTCYGTTLNGQGAKCNEEIKCLVVNVDTSMVFAALDSYASYKLSLKKC
jgi:hypothetical protein